MSVTELSAEHTKQWDAGCAVGLGGVGLLAQLLVRLLVRQLAQLLAQLALSRVLESLSIV